MEVVNQQRLLRDLWFIECTVHSDALSALDGHEGLNRMVFRHTSFLREDDPPAIPYLPNLTEFDTEGTPFDDQSLRAIARSSFLKKLILAGSHVTGELLRTLTCTDTLTFLSIKHIPTFNLDNLEHLSRLKELRILQAGGLPLSEDSFRSFSQMPQLRELGVQDSAVEDHWLAALSGHPTLEDFRVNSKAFQGTGLAHLPVETIRRLDLWGSSVSDSVTVSILRFPLLQHLEVQDTKVTLDGLVQLASVLQGCEIKHPEIDHARERVPLVSPLARYRFDDASDSLGRNPDGCFERVAWAHGCLYLDGSYLLGIPKGYLAYMNTPQLDPFRFTLGMRFYPIELGRSGSLHIVTVGPHSSTFVLRQREGALEVSLSFSKYKKSLAPHHLNLNEWNTIVCALDYPGRSVRLLLNGMFLDELILPQELCEPAKNHSIHFTNRSSAGTFTGYWDELLVYNGAMQQDEMTSLYAEIVASIPPLDVMPDPREEERLAFLEQVEKSDVLNPDQGGTFCPETTVTRPQGGQIEKTSLAEQHNLFVEIERITFNGCVVDEDTPFVCANPEKAYTLRIEAAYKADGPTKLAANLGPDVGEVFANIGLLAEGVEGNDSPSAFQLIAYDMQNEMKNFLYNQTIHFDTEASPGYSSVSGEGKISFNLTSWAPPKPGQYAKTIDIGLYDHDTWRTIVKMEYPFILFVKEPVNYSNRINHKGKDLFLGGVNVHCRAERPAFCNDVIDLDEGWFAEMMNEVRNSGGNSIRWWIHPDGGNLKYDNDLKVIGLDTKHLGNMEAVLNLAKEYGILVNLCLWSFDMIQNSSKYDPEYGDHQKTLTEENYINAYIENALVPMVGRFKNHPAVLSWEILNEPEGMTDELEDCGSGWTYFDEDDGKVYIPRRVEMESIQAFINRIAGAIHREAPDSKVTVGCWSFYSLGAGGHKNYYSDEELIEKGGDCLGTLDFYQVHYFPASYIRCPKGESVDSRCELPKGLGEDVSPFHHDAREWKLDKPIVLGEFPPCDFGNLGKDELYKELEKRDYAGAWGWNYLCFWEGLRDGLQAVGGLDTE